MICFLCKDSEICNSAVSYFRIMSDMADENVREKVIAVCNHHQLGFCNMEISAISLMSMISAAKNSVKTEFAH